jgi:hypothetical protein
MATTAPIYLDPNNGALVYKDGADFKRVAVDA